jgi:tRNA pseudouridine65 synthase
MADKQLPVLFQDDHFIVVNKPSGLLVHRSPIDRQATEFAVQTVRDQIGQKVFPVHRLDRPTSGALVFALSVESARFLALEFQQGRVLKKYWAVVRGVPPTSVTVDYPLREELVEEMGGGADRMSRPEKPPQSAITQFRTLASCELPVRVDRYPTSRYSLVEAIPVTGRRHQIRRHLSHLRHPIIGDSQHGVGKHNRFFKSEFEIARLLLACTELSFRHPFAEHNIRVKAPLAEDFERVLRALNWTQVQQDGMTGQNKTNLA